MEKFSPFNKKIFFLVASLVAILFFLSVTRPQVSHGQDAVVTPTYFCAGSSSCVDSTPTLGSYTIVETTTPFPTTDTPTPTIAGSSVSSSVISSPTPCIQMATRKTMFCGDGGCGRGRGGGDNGSDNSSLWQLLMILINWLLQLLGINTGTTGTGTATSLDYCLTTPTPSLSVSADSSVYGLTPTTDTSGTSILTPTTIDSLTSVLTPTTAVSADGTAPTVLPAATNSTNWAGYIYAVPSGTVNAILTTTYSVSDVKCASKGVAAPWIGFGGYSTTSKEIAQLGTEWDCRSGTPVYSAWTEAYPAASVPYNNTVKPGDQIIEKITFTGNGKYDTYMKDVTQGWEISLPMTLNNAGGNAEVIMEAPSSSTGQQLKMGSFGVVNFAASNFSNSSTTADQPLASAPSLERNEVVWLNDPYTKTSGISGSNFSITSLK